MKIVRFSDGTNTGYGTLHGETVQRLRNDPFIRLEPEDSYYDLGNIKLLAPCLPSKIVAVGLNYRSHALEINMPLPPVPLLFMKPSTAVIGQGESIIYPESSEQVDYEGELGVVIGRAARRVPVEEARDYILGYTCCNDVTARDLQQKDKQWTRAKGFDTFAPLGPCIETELEPDDVPLQTYLNGELKQSSSTSDLIFSVAGLVSFISHVMTLLPGDAIATGTPGGIGPMHPGDTVEIRIEPIGTLVNYVAK